MKLHVGEQLWKNLKFAAVTEMSQTSNIAAHHSQQRGTLITSFSNNSE